MELLKKICFVTRDLSRRLSLKSSVGLTVQFRYFSLNSEPLYFPVIKQQHKITKKTNKHEDVMDKDTFPRITFSRRG